MAITPQTSRASHLLSRGRRAPRTAKATTGAPQAQERRAPLRLVGEQTSSILVASSDAGRRRTLLQELSQQMPEGTRFQEAAATWEVLEHAPSSRLVMLAGELDGSSAESVMHLLGKRHPQLPVLALSAA